MKPVISTLSTVLFILAIFAYPALGATIYVDWNGGGDYLTIQAGIDAAVDGDTVLVAPGTYVENVDFLGKEITVQSEDGAELTVIDGNQSGSVVTFTFSSGETELVFLDGFTIRNGDSPQGGGIYCRESSPTITNCTISANDADWEGGGIYCELFSTPTIKNCTISENFAKMGGGIGCDRVSDPEIRNCMISENISTDYGGGIYCLLNSRPTITNCTLAGNICYAYGGGIYCSQNSYPKLTNCIFYGNLHSEIQIADISSLTVQYSDIRGGAEAASVGLGCTLDWGLGNIDLDPLFVDPWGRDYHLSAASPCIDAGTDAGVSDDIDGDIRQQGCGYDIGADETSCEDCDADYYPNSTCGGTDCDDSEPSIFPGAQEICDNGDDDDCVGGDELSDDDGDGYVDEVCGGDDCDDEDGLINPGMTEGPIFDLTCYDGLDNDCDGGIDLDDPLCICWDDDGDGYEDLACGGDDCDDSDPYVNPGADEDCYNEIDDDCDGLVDFEDEWDCPEQFIINLDASYVDGILDLNFSIGSTDPATWVTYWILTSPTIQFLQAWSIKLPKTFPPSPYSISMPFPGIGLIGIYTGLFLEGSAQAVDFAWVFTG